MDARKDNPAERDDAWAKDIQEYWRCRLDPSADARQYGQAFTRFCKACSDIVAKLLSRYKLHPEDADDIAQKVFADLLPRMAKLRDATTPLGFRSLLGQIVHSKVVDLRRSLGRHSAFPLDAVIGTQHEPPSCPVLATEELDLKEAAERARASLQRLGKEGTDLDMRIVAMRYLDGLSNAEVAGALKFRASA